MNKIFFYIIHGQIVIYGGDIMDFITMIIIVLLSYVIIQLAIDRSINTKILKENLKVLIEIRELLKKQDKDL